MRLTRANAVLLAAVAVLAAADLGLRQPGPARRTVEKLLPGLFRDRAARLVLERGAERLELRRDGEGRWVLPEHFGHPARADLVQNLLAGLTSLTTLDLLSDDPASHAEYGVGEGALVLRVWDAADEPLAALVQGDAVERASYVRRLGEDAVYRAPRLRALTLDGAGWLDAQWLSFAPATVLSLRLSGRLLEAPRAFQRDETTVSRWTDDGGAVVSTRRVQDVLSSLRSLFLEQVVAAQAPEPAAGEGPLLELEVGLLDGSQRRAVFGPELPEGAVLATHGPGDFVVRLPAAGWTVVQRAVAELTP